MILGRLVLALPSVVVVLASCAHFDNPRLCREHGDALSGNVTDGWLRRRDPYTSAFAGGQHYRAFRIRASHPGPLRVELSTDDFTPALIVHAPAGLAVYHGASPTTPEGARTTVVDIARPVVGGEYCVLVTHSGELERDGRFTLRIHGQTQ